MNIDEAKEFADLLADRDSLLAERDSLRNQRDQALSIRRPCPNCRGGGRVSTSMSRHSQPCGRCDGRGWLADEALAAAEAEVVSLRNQRDGLKSNLYGAREMLAPFTKWPAEPLLVTVDSVLAEVVSLRNQRDAARQEFQRTEVAAEIERGARLAAEARVEALTKAAQYVERNQNTPHFLKEYLRAALAASLPERQEDE